MRRLIVGTFVGVAAICLPAVAGARVLRVGTYHGIKGQYRSIPAAVKAAHAGDWILVGPGDYKTHSSHRPTTGSPQGDFPAAVLITQARLHLRGMNRNRVIVDGTKSGPPCNRIQGDQNFGPKTQNGRAGLNGIMIWKARKVWVQNLTACNFLGGTGDAGNGIWWNGGADSGKVGGWGFLGSYLTATSTFFKDEPTAATYGIFSSNWSGGAWRYTYASNFNDSDYYIGACRQICNQTVSHAWGEFSALGYSGSNSGGRLVIKHSQFDNNEDGFDTNSQNGDEPSPQNGACPNNGISPITHTHSCWVFMDNYVHDNNNPNIPSAGSAAAGPVGTGMSVTGGRNDTIMDNRFVNNKAWGLIFVPYPDSGPPCTGGTGGGSPGAVCWYDDWGNSLFDNKFSRNGGYGNQTNGDFAELTKYAGHPINCYHGNTDTDGKVTSSPSKLQHTNAKCGQKASQPDTNHPFLIQVLCDSQIFGPGPCANAKYPRRTKVIMHPLPGPKQLRTMPNPCKGVPSNPWCRKR